MLYYSIFELEGGLSLKHLKHRKICFSLIGLVLVTLLLFIGAGFYFFKLACVPGPKSFLNSSSKTIKKSDPLYREKTWFKKVHKQKWYISSADHRYRLDANYIPSNSSYKTAVILPGYMDTKEDMGEYDALFHQMGYNTLTPDPRSQGKSEGKYIGYGWPEKDDVKKWINLIIKKEGSKQQIVVYGLSAGAATTMMVSGLELPKQVKAFVEDCGYTSVKDEIEHEAQVLYHMPAFPRFPLVEILSGINKLKVGYFMKDGSSVNQLHKNHRPMLFIHGNCDTFVPTDMVYTNYQATKGPKELWVTSKAKHAKSFADHPRAYRKHIETFLDKYIK
ncbi:MULTISPECIES: alpha/beta hydrolase [unclassified Lactobacillus]|uniref:alpha/beta hydrolase n=1 Tax=unclassified Lactobacillus TaxID=2620435 RepID=UPI000EFC56EF|nr:alpha/beta hydrolase [Lactobacillus sp. ESL0247]RMC29334.1 alpha/beta hydrolase [Lactobacillus sp. ESL0246]RMC32844.1 alpha/beta hydrolase [Lactobacillus sp. ESL0245]